MLLTVNAFAENKPLKRLQFGASVSADYTHRVMISNKGSQGNFEVTYLNEIEAGVIRYSAGFNMAFNFGNSFSLESGLICANRGYQSNRLGTYNPNKNPANPDQLKYIRDYYFLDIPLKANFSAGKGRMKFIFGGGVVGNILLTARQTNYNYYTDYTTKDNTPLYGNFRQF